MVVWIWREAIPKAEGRDARHDQVHQPRGMGRAYGKHRRAEDDPLEDVRLLQQQRTGHETAHAVGHHEQLSLGFELPQSLGDRFEVFDVLREAVDDRALPMRTGISRAQALTSVVVHEHAVSIAVEHLRQRQVAEIRLVPSLRRPRPLL
eukprot:scaffold7059_cov250-Pinguiococcus_pyrenoidosus.AAC.11